MEELKLTDEEINELIERYESELRKLRFHISHTEESISMLKKALKSNAKNALKAENQPKKKNKIKTAKVEKQAATSLKSEVEAAEQVLEAAPAVEAIMENIAMEAKVAESVLEEVMDALAEAASQKREKRKRITVTLPKPGEESMQAQKAAKRGPGRPRKVPAAVEAAAAAVEKVSEEGKKSKDTRSARVEKIKEKQDADAGKVGYKLSEFDEMIMEALRTKNHVLINADFIQFITDKLNAAGTPEDHEEIKKKVSRSLHKLTAKRNDLLQVEHSGRGVAYAFPEWVKNGRTKPQYRRKRV
jgi:hypothetical protein